MSEQEEKDLIMESMINDLGIDCIEYTPATAKNVPFWLLELCDLLIRKGWRKQ